MCVNTWDIQIFTHIISSLHILTPLLHHPNPQTTTWNGNINNNTKEGDGGTPVQSIVDLRDRIASPMGGRSSRLFWLFQRTVTYPWQVAQNLRVNLYRRRRMYIIDLTHPRKCLWNNFFFTLTMLVKKAKKQWNPMKKKMMPWIDLVRVKAMHDAGKHGHTRQSAGSHGGHNGHHHQHHTTYSTQHDRPKSPPSDCQKAPNPKQKRPKQKSPTSDHQKREASSEDRSQLKSNIAWIQFYECVST